MDGSATGRRAVRGSCWEPPQAQLEVSGVGVSVFDCAPVGGKLSPGSGFGELSTKPALRPSGCRRFVVSVVEELESY